MNFFNMPEKSDLNSIEESDQQITSPTPLQFQMHSGTVSTKHNQVQFVHIEDPDQFSQTQQQPPTTFQNKSGVSYQDLKPSQTMKVHSSKKSSMISCQQANTLIKAIDIENEMEEPNTLD